MQNPRYQLKLDKNSFAPHVLWKNELKICRLMPFVWDCNAHALPPAIWQS